MNFILLYIIIVPTIIISIIALRNSKIMDTLKFNPSHINNSREWYRFFSYGMVHGSYIHLAVNIYVLWTFGTILISDFNILFGNAANLCLLALYIPSLCLSVIPTYYKHRNNYLYNAVGASGAISAIVYASIILNPNIGMGLIFIPIALPAWFFGLLYLVYTAIMSRKENSLIGHSSHLWGAIYGMVFILITSPSSYLSFYYSIINNFR